MGADQGQGHPITRAALSGDEPEIIEARYESDERPTPPVRQRRWCYANCERVVNLVSRELSRRIAAITYRDEGTTDGLRDLRP